MNVLILEDDIETQKLFCMFQGEKINLLQAYNIGEAERLFDENKDSLDVVALDGMVPKGEGRFKDTVALAEYIRRSFDGTMYSLSQSDSIKKEFRRIGEENQGKGFEILEFKFDLIERIQKLLGGSFL